MKVANSIKINVFIKEGEDEEKVKQKLLSLIPFSIEESPISKNSATGFNESKITIYEILLEKDRHIKEFLDNLIAKLDDEIKERILQQAESRLDEEGNFFLRFKKDKYMDENKLYLTDQGNCFHIKINIAAFPKKREIELGIIRNIFKGKE